MTWAMTINSDDESRKRAREESESVRKGEIISLSNNRIGISRYYTRYYIVCVVEKKKPSLHTHTRQVHYTLSSWKKNRDRQA